MSDISDSAAVEVWVRGALGPAARKAFAEFHLDVGQTITVISGELTQDELHQVLDRIHSLTLELVDVRRLGDDLRPQSPE